MRVDKCFFCNQDAEIKPQGPLVNEYLVNCAKNCGTYIISSNLDMTPLNSVKRSMISGYISELNEISQERVKITNSNINDILNSSIIARTAMEKANKFLLYMFRRTSYFGQAIQLFREHYSLCYAVHADEFDKLKKQILNEGYIEAIDINNCCLTFKGLRASEDLMKTYSLSKSAFVAMWFSDEMKTVFEKAIKPAIEAKECGDFVAFRVDNKEHNNDITDEILAGIKACRFMVADLTGYRGGVYFEAGYAKGLGKTVILTCRNDWLKNVTDVQGMTLREGVHFDLNHQNIIVWDDLEELKLRIINRIRYTIL